MTPERDFDHWGPRFLLELARVPNVAGAARKAGISRKTAYVYREAVPEFAQRWDEAINSALDDLEGAAFQRAKKQSDTLTIFLLKSHRPALYGDRSRTDLNVTGDLKLDAAAIADVVRRARAES